MNHETEPVIQTILARMSCRDFEERDVEEEKRRLIYNAIIAAPTTDNMTMYTVISVDSRETRQKLSKQPAILRAPMVLVFCADYRRWSKVFDGLTESGRKPELGEYQLALIDAVIAAQNAVIAAEGLGLGSVYLGDIMEHYEERAEALGCPAGVVPVLTLCIGYATQKQRERAPTRRIREELLIHEEQYHDFSAEEILGALKERGNYENVEMVGEWLKKFSRRCVEGKGALERTRSIRAAVESISNI